MKPEFINKITLPYNCLPTVDDDIYKIKYEFASHIVDSIDNHIINQLFEIYKGSSISDIYVIDKKQFEVFLKKMLPIYVEETDYE